MITENIYDIQIVSLPWGNCPMNALEHDNKDHNEIFKRIARQNISRQPDVFIQVSVPNEFQNVGKYNIGVTAGIETTIVSHEFLQHVVYFYLTVGRVGLELLLQVLD